jgi:hypothetical protein
VRRAVYLIHCRVLDHRVRMDSGHFLDFDSLAVSVPPNNAILAGLLFVAFKGSDLDAAPCFISAQSLPMAMSPGCENM